MKKDCIVSIEGSKEGAKGPLVISAEIFELTPSFSVVDVKKKGGDRGGGGGGGLVITYGNLTPFLCGFFFSISASSYKFSSYDSRSSLLELMPSDLFKIRFLLIYAICFVDRIMEKSWKKLLERRLGKIHGLKSVKLFITSLSHGPVCSQVPLTHGYCLSA